MLRADHVEHSPELNPAGHIGDALREKHLHNLTFDSLDVLEDQLVNGLSALENDPIRVKSICGDMRLGLDC